MIDERGKREEERGKREGGRGGAGLEAGAIFV
jgi:hypothetical protein